VFNKSGYARATRAAKTGFMQDSLAAAVVPRSLVMARESLIRCRVSEEVKRLLRTIAAQRQTTESALVRQLIEAMVQMATDAKIAGAGASNRVIRDGRLYVRLEPQDRILLSDRAAARGMPSATYVSVLVRSHLRNLTPLPKEELLALKRSVAELGTIGRNLNQIARAANHSGRPPGPGREDLRAMLGVAEGLRDYVKALLRANRPTTDKRCLEKGLKRNCWKTGIWIWRTIGARPTLSRALVGRRRSWCTSSCSRCRRGHPQTRSWRR
jgi:predicted DNA-binding protein